MKKKGPWKIKSSEVVYKNPRMKVIEDKVIRPDGEDGIYGVVDIGDAVCVLPIDDEENVYLNKNFRYAINKMSLEIVSGKVERAENKLSAAKRELKEELGITAKKWIYLGMVHPLSGSVHNPGHLYLARGLKLGKDNQDATENIEMVKMSLQKAIDFVFNGKIDCAISMVAILKAQYYLKNESKQ